MSAKHTPGPWVRFNPLTQTYDTPDGTAVACELVDNAQTLADVLQIASIREKQRAAAAIAKAIRGAA